MGYFTKTIDKNYLELHQLKEKLYQMNEKLWSQHILIENQSMLLRDQRASIHSLEQRFSHLQGNICQLRFRVSPS